MVLWTCQGFLFEFRASRYVAGHNRTSVSLVLAVQISDGLSFSYSSMSIYNWPCQTIILSRDDHLLKFWFLLAKLSCLTPVVAQYERFFYVSVKNAKNTQGEGQKGHSKYFLDPSSPSLASGSPRPPNCLGVKEPARLGEPTYFRMKHQLAWASSHGSKGHFLL